MSLEPNIHDNSQGLQGPAYIPPTTPVTSSEKPASAKSDQNGISTIEQSEAVASLIIASMSMPLLIPPSEDKDASSIAAITGNLAALSGIQSAMIKQEILDKWAANLNEINEQVKAQINSPAYQVLLDIKLHGDPSQSNVSGVQSTNAGNIAAVKPVGGSNGSIFSAVENAKIIERISPAEKTSSMEAASILVPMTAVVMVGGALAIGGMEVSMSTTGMSSTPLQGTMQIIDQLQPLFPTLSIQDMIPMINLMVMAPIYFNSWVEATSRLPNKERNNDVETAQKFAQDVIKMVSNPDYIMVTFVNKMSGTSQMSPDQKQQASTVMRLILSTVALSLLYSVETGKVQSGKFWGIEPQELRDILNGNIPGPDPSEQSTQQQKLSGTLINLVQAQLAALPNPQRLQTINAILNYVSSNHTVKNMLDPQKVISSVIDSMEFDLNEAEKIDRRRA